MYNVSNDYLEKINSVSREVYWYGTVTLTDGTVYNFDTSNLKQGQTSIIRQLCANQKIQIGCTCSSELKIAFMLDYDPEMDIYYMNDMEVDRYKFYDAEIVIIFRLYLDDEKITYEDINLGTYIVSSPERTQTVLTCTAYDYMQKFTKACVSELQGTPYSVLLSACAACGVELGTPPEDIYKMVNGRNTCAMYDPRNEINTWRDAIGFVCAMIGCNATIKADNKLYIIPYDVEPIRTITSGERVSLTLEDYVTNYIAITSVNLRTNTEERIKQSDEGLVYAMGSNPLIQYVLSANRLEVLSRLLLLLVNMDYVPFSGSFFTDPSFELGDVIEFTDNHAGTSTKSVITAIEIRLNSHMVMSCSGDNPYMQKAEEAANPDYSSSTSGSVGDGVQFYDYFSTNDITVTTDPEQILLINYESNGAYRQEFKAEVYLEVYTAETTENSTYVEDDCIVTVTYYINGQEVSYHPQYTYLDGVYTLQLFYVWTSNIRTDVSTFTANLSINGGSVSVKDVCARIMQAGEAYVAPSNDIEYIEKVHDPNKTLYRLGEHLDYTGLVINAWYEDGHGEDITNQCICTPANGSLVSEEKNFIIVTVDYVKDNVPYTTDFELEVKYLEMLDVKKEPTKTEYFVGETIDYSGVKIMAEFSNDTKSDVTSSCTFSPANGTTLSQDGSVTVTVSYTYDGITRTTTFVLSVQAVMIEEFAVTPPTKVKYDEGETLDYTGLVAIATYNNGNVVDVTNSCSFSPANGSLADPDETIVTVSYVEGGQEYTDTFDIEVVTFDGIEVNTEQANLSYWLGDETDYTGVTVSGKFSDGTSIDVTNDCTFNPANGVTTTISMSEVVVTYIRDNRMYQDSFFIEVKEPEPVLKYLIYTTDTNQRKIYVSGLNVSEMAEDNLRNLVIPATYTDPESGITFDLILVGDTW